MTIEYLHCTRSFELRLSSAVMGFAVGAEGGIRRHRRLPEAVLRGAVARVRKKGTGCSFFPSVQILPRAPGVVGRSWPGWVLAREL